MTRGAGGSGRSDLPGWGARLGTTVYFLWRRAARAYLRKERPNHTLQPTELANEAYLRLQKLSSAPSQISNQDHLVNLGKLQMRRILVEHARRPRPVRVDCENVEIPDKVRSRELVALDDALRQLERVNARAANVVELKIFEGFTDNEVVEHLDLSLSTVRRDWQEAIGWLQKHMKKEPVNGISESQKTDNAEPDNPSS